MRTIEVAPNGHRNSVKRRLLDKGVKYILLTCRSMFRFAGRRRHLYPYAENPFSSMDLDRIPVEDSKPIRLLTTVQETALLSACDDWQFPIILTLMTTGLRPGELLHLLLPHRQRPWSLYEKQDRSRLESPAHRGDFNIDVLEGTNISSNFERSILFLSSHAIEHVISP